MFKLQVKLDAGMVQENLNRMAARGQHTGTLMRSIGADVKARVQMGFNDGSDPYGKPWVALKSRQGQPLRDTGALMNSIGIVSVSDSHVKVGTGLAYAAPHQHGAKLPALIVPKHKKALAFGGRVVKSVKGGVIPPRPFLPTSGGGLPALWERSIAQATILHLKNY